MMVRKQSYYSERTVYPWVTEDDLEMGLLGAVRDALRANDADHPWRKPLMKSRDESDKLVVFARFANTLAIAKTIRIARYQTDKTVCVSSPQ